MPALQVTQLFDMYEEVGYAKPPPTLQDSTMPKLPPFEMIQAVLLQAVLLPFAVAAVIFFVVHLITSGRGTSFAAGLAVAIAFLSANNFRNVASAQLDPKKPFTVPVFLKAAKLALRGPSESLAAGENTSDDETLPLERPPPIHYWLPWVTALALVVGILVRSLPIPAVIGWQLRNVIVLLAACLLVAPEWRANAIGILFLYFVAAATQWGLVEDLGKRMPGGWLAAAMGFALFGLGGVLLYAHSARMSDISVILGSSCCGIALAAWRRKADSGGVAPAVAIVLPGLAILGKYLTFSDVPRCSFGLAALAPCALAVMLIPRIGRLHGIARPLMGIAIVLIPAAIALGIAMDAESLPDFEQG